MKTAAALLAIGSFLSGYELFPSSITVGLSRINGPELASSIVYNHGKFIDTGTWKYAWEIGPAARASVGLFGSEIGLGYRVGQRSKFGPATITGLLNANKSYGEYGLAKESGSRIGGLLLFNLIIIEIGGGFYSDESIDIKAGYTFHL